MKKDIIQVIFWGSLWGAAEATLGYLIHRAAIFIPGLPGFLMFPIAFYFMRMVYMSTDQATSVLRAAILAALIKCSDLIIPGNIPIRILNPALSILLEGLAVTLVFIYCNKREIKLNFIYSCIMGALWRVLFVVNLLVISIFNLPAAIVTNGILSSLRFVFGESFINGLLIYGYLKLEQPRWVCNPKPIYSYGMLLTALAIQLVMN